MKNIGARRTPAGATSIYCRHHESRGLGKVGCYRRTEERALKIRQRMVAADVQPMSRGEERRAREERRKR